MRFISIALLLQVLTAPDPAQMENAPDLGYQPVPHGMQIPVDVEMGAPSSVAWTSTDTILVFNRGPNPLMEFNPRRQLRPVVGAGSIPPTARHARRRGGTHLDHRRQRPHREKDELRG